MLTEKEKLEEELNLLKESLDLNVITKEEFENAKQRIEVKLKELRVLEQKKDESKEKSEVGEIKKSEEEPKITEELKPDGGKEEEKIEIKELNENDIKKEEIEHEVTKEEGTEEKVKPEEERKEAEFEEVKTEEVKVTEEKVAEEVEKPSEEAKVTEEVKAADEVEKPSDEDNVTEDKVPEEEVEEKEATVEEKQPEVVEEDKKSSKKIFVYIAIIVILGFAGLYYYYTGSELVISEDIPTDIPSDNVIILIACSSDKECSREGSIGICNNPGQEDAECEYIEDAEIKLTILNSDSCFNCGTARILSILKGFYPNINVENIDFETREGKELRERFLINALPAYIFNSSFKEAYNYDKLSNSFNEAKANFVMKNTVANANYYLDRKEIQYKLELIVKNNQTASIKAEENLKEFFGII